MSAPKKKVVISYDKLNDKIKKELSKKYPDGISDVVFKVDLGPEKSFYAITHETEEIKYLIKVNVNIDFSDIDDDDIGEDDLFDSGKIELANQD